MEEMKWLKNSEIDPENLRTDKILTPMDVGDRYSEIFRESDVFVASIFERVHEQSTGSTKK